MLTSFEQVVEWIKDNGFKRWILYKDYLKSEMIIDSAAFPVSDQKDKLAMTEKYLRLAGGHAYAVGGANATKSEMNVCTEIQLANVQPLSAQGAAGIGNNYPTIGELTETITKQVRAEMAAEDFKRREKELAEREKEFNEKQNGVIGALVGVFAPYLPVLNQVAGMRKVAGVDANGPVHAQPIIPTDGQESKQEEPEVENPFSEEEEEELFALLSEFKKVEPNYLPMLRKVVEMAKAGDKTYEMAKNFLL